jgi:Ca-activated chloride channel family protein
MSVVPRPRLLALGLLALAVPSTAQEPPAPVFKSDVDIVNVTVSVRDEHGHFIPDLESGDFVVYEEGRPQRIQVFARSKETGEAASEALSLDLGLLMDTSESMLKQLRMSQHAATKFLEAVPRAHELVTIFFDQDLRISRYDSENQQGLFERIQDTKPGGMTALRDAITVYLSRVQDSPGRKVLLIFTDGEDSSSVVGLQELMRMLRASSVTVYPVALLGGFAAGSPSAMASKAFLKELAEVSGGALFAPTEWRELATIYQKILDELSSQYVIGFVSDNGVKDGKFRKLRVEVHQKNLKVRHRAGYYSRLALPER